MLGQFSRTGTDSMYLNIGGLGQCLWDSGNNKKKNRSTDSK